MNILPDGILNIDKSSGSTSMEVVRFVKKMFSKGHVGHGGTLDPLATGVLPICLGSATKIMQFLVGGEKEYLATIHLGVSTDTYDADGSVISETDTSGLDKDIIEESLMSFVGTIEQIPPMYSALKSNGRRLYSLARSNIEIERLPRTVNIGEIQLISWVPPFIKLLIRCSKGVYIRSIAHDLGSLLGCGGHLSALRRLRTGSLKVEDAVQINILRDLFEKDDWESILLPVDYALLNMRGIHFNMNEENKIRHGQSVSNTSKCIDFMDTEIFRAYGPGMNLMALVRIDGNLQTWHPYKVFNLSLPSPFYEENIVS